MSERLDKPPGADNQTESDQNGWTASVLQEVQLAAAGDDTNFSQYQHQISAEIEGLDGVQISGPTRIIKEASDLASSIHDLNKEITFSLFAAVACFVVITELQREPVQTQVALAIEQLRNTYHLAEMLVSEDFEASFPFYCAVLFAFGKAILAINNLRTLHNQQKALFWLALHPHIQQLKAASTENGVELPTPDASATIAATSDQSQSNPK